MSGATVRSPAHSAGPREGEAIWFNGALIEVKVPGAWSDGAFSLVEVTSTAGRATGLHTDPSQETFRILEGELLFHVDGEEHRALEGETVAIPREVPHAFVVVSNTARFMVLNTPGTHDAFFRDGGEPAAERDVSAAPAPNLERTMESARKHGVRFLGPPPFDPAGVRLTSG
jgi:quercetin dioxygenase-like cupin family protein